MAQFKVYYTDAGEGFAITVEGSDADDALAGAVAFLKRSGDWSDARHQAWIVDDSGKELAVCKFVTG